MDKTRVMGITADADCYHLKCAIDQYGEPAIKTVVKAEADDISDDDIIAAFLEDLWPEDREHNPIRALVSPRDDLFIYGGQYQDGERVYPAVCGACLHLIASERDIVKHGGAVNDGAVQF